MSLANLFGALWRMSVHEKCRFEPNWIGKRQNVNASLRQMLVISEVRFPFQLNQEFMNEKEFPTSRSMKLRAKNRTSLSCLVTIVVITKFHGDILRQQQQVRKIIWPCSLRGLILMRSGNVRRLLTTLQPC